MGVKPYVGIVGYATKMKEVEMETRQNRSPQQIGEQLSAAAQRLFIQYSWATHAEGWHRWALTIAQFFDPPTETMFDLVGMQAGDRVLDVAAGTGAQTLLAARRVGPSGFVLATDLSPKMLAFAADEIRNAGLTNVETQVMDGEKLDLAEESFDRVICRTGMHLFPDPLKALVDMQRVVKSGKKVAVMDHSVPENCSFLAIADSQFRQRAMVPPPETPGLFSVAKPGKLQGLYEKAGFQDVQIVTVPTLLKLPSAAECVIFVQEGLGALQQMAPHLSNAERQVIWKELEQELRRYEGPEGFEAPHEFVLGVGTK